MEIFPPEEEPPPETGPQGAPAPQSTLAHPRQHCPPPGWGPRGPGLSSGRFTSPPAGRCVTHRVVGEGLTGPPCPQEFSLLHRPPSPRAVGHPCRQDPRKAPGPLYVVRVDGKGWAHVASGRPSAQGPTRAWYTRDPGKQKLGGDGGAMGRLPRKYM